MSDSRKFSLNQRIIQEGCKFFISATVPYALTECLPNMLLPGKSLFEVSCVPMASIMVDEGYALVYQADPTAHWRALGGGSLAKGLIKLGTARASSLAIFLGSGYVMAEFSMKFIAKLAQSQHPAAHFLAEVLIIPSYRQAALGILTYGGHKAMTAIGLKLWECCWPESEKRAGTWDEPHLLQHGAGYLMRLLFTIAPAETIFYYLRDQQLAELAANWRFQMAMLTSVHAAIWTADNYAARPHEVPAADIEAASVTVPVRKGIPWKYVAPAALMVGAYAFSELLCAYMETLNDPGYCKKDTFGARVGRFAAQVAGPVAAAYALTEVIPSIHLKHSCHAFFQRLRREPVEEKQALLSNMVAGK